MKVFSTRRETEDKNRPQFFLSIQAENRDEEMVLEQIVLDSADGFHYNPGAVTRAGEDRVFMLTFPLRRDI